jgi:hypothetical protein
MDVPDLVAAELDDESVLASVDVGGGDGVFVTPGRTLVYRSDGLLSDESVSEYPHGFQQLTLSEGRRRARFRFDTIDGERDFAVGTDHAHDVLRTVLAGHLRATGTLGESERVRGVYRFQELTLVVGTERLLKHVGGAAWSEEYDAYPYADLTDLDFEEGDHALQVVISVAGRPERIKLPADRAPQVRRTLEQAVFGFHDVASLAELQERIAPAEEPDDEATAVYGDAVDPLIGEDADGSETTADTAGDEAVSEIGTPGDWSTPMEGEDAGDETPDDVAARLDDIEAELERQTELIERQQETIEQLVDELRRGR